MMGDISPPGGSTECVTPPSAEETYAPSYVCRYPACSFGRAAKKHNCERHVWLQHVRRRVVGMEDQQYCSRDHREHVSKYVAPYLDKDEPISSQPRTYRPVLPKAKDEAPRLEPQNPPLLQSERTNGFQNEALKFEPHSTNHISRQRSLGPNDWPIPRGTEHAPHSMRRGSQTTVVSPDESLPPSRVPSSSAGPRGFPWVSAPSTPHMGGMRRHSSASTIKVMGSEYDDEQALVFAPNPSRDHRPIKVGVGRLSPKHSPTSRRHSGVEASGGGGRRVVSSTPTNHPWVYGPQPASGSGDDERHDVITEGVPSAHFASDRRGRFGTMLQRHPYLDIPQAIASPGNAWRRGHTAPRTLHTQSLDVLCARTQGNPMCLDPPETAPGPGWMGPHYTNFTDEMAHAAPAAEQDGPVRQPGVVGRYTETELMTAHTLSEMPGPFGQSVWRPW